MTSRNRATLKGNATANFADNTSGDISASDSRIQFQDHADSHVNFNDDVGTAANEIVQLDASARLPAVDGSQLTNLPASSPPTTFLAVGTYSLVVIDSGQAASGGATVAGSVLRTAIENSGSFLAHGGALTGTWRVMSGEIENGSVGLVVRIS